MTRAGSPGTPLPAPPATPSATVPALSVVIPVLDEAEGLSALLADLDVLDAQHEVIVVDGGSTDGSVQIATLAGAIVVHSQRGRGPQLIAGARAARGNVLCFLHADSRLTSAATSAVDRFARERPSYAAAFTFRISGEGARYRFIEFGTRLRSRWAALPYGDQGLLLTRDTYDRAGGYPPAPLMEDVALVRALNRSGEVRILDESILISDRRWRRDGPLRRMLRNWMLLVAYLMGVPPSRLASHYPPHSRQPDADRRPRQGS